MKKIKMLLFFCLFLSKICFAQKGNYYFDQKGQVCEKEKAYYMRNVEYQEDERYKVSDFLITGQKYRVGYANIDIAYQWFYNENGLSTKYHLNGNVSEEVFYENGLMIGNAKKYYENGKPLTVYNYSYKNPHKKEYQNQEMKLVSAYDSTGNQLVTNGNGYFMTYDSIFSQRLIERGKYLNGKKDSIWTGTYMKNNEKKVYYEEKYEQGKLIKGTSYDLEGIKYEYATKADEPAEFVGGQEALNKYMSENVIYPKAARKQGIAGRVVVKFVIEKDGSLSDIKIMRSVHPLLDDEAVRFVSTMPKWSPGKHRGKGVKSYFTFPLNFMLR